MRRSPPGSSHRWRRARSLGCSLRAAREQERESQLWLTFKQALALGGAVRKGERGTPIVYADRLRRRANVRKRNRQAGPRGKSPSSSGTRSFTWTSATGFPGTPSWAGRPCPHGRSSPRRKG
ncbi:ArdC family protein [Parvularcula sp. LCG005]|nr:ArdC family protein [Parvularcula sp. LCG005]WOI54815.1 ArdC family protein [Parvularcula sp. LCG005]